VCILLVAIRHDPRFPLVVAANRDEYYDRPAAPASLWQDSPGLLAGRDLSEGGTWLGVTRSGRFAALTNVREPGRRLNNAPSRGSLVRAFLEGTETPDEFGSRLSDRGSQFNGFALLFGSPEGLHHFSNRGDGMAHPLPAGIHGLSNGPLNAPWPKVARGTAALREILANTRAHPDKALFDLLADRTLPADDDLPSTGVGLEWERLLAPLFVVTPVHGTRCSTVILVDRTGRVRFEERSFDRRGSQIGRVSFDFTLNQP
jgi:uncharacterized protein with NRDE domain